MIQMPRGCRPSACNHAKFRPKVRGAIYRPDQYVRAPIDLRDQNERGLCWFEAIAGAIERYIDDSASAIWGAAIYNTTTGARGDNGGTAIMAARSLSEHGYLKHVYSECADDVHALQTLSNPVDCELLDQAASTRARPVLTSIDVRDVDAPNLVRAAIVAGHDVYADGPCNDQYIHCAQTAQIIGPSCMTGSEGHAIRIVGFVGQNTFVGYTSWRISGPHIGSEWPIESDGCQNQGLLLLDRSALPAFWSLRPVVGVEY